MESFWARMKTKIGIPFLFDDVYDAKAEIYNYVHIYYNRQRMHSAIGYMSLVRFEEQILSKQRGNLSSQLQPRKISLIPAT
ncbi:MAG: Integrase core domain, partial [Bacteroidota bacterium]